MAHNGPTFKPGFPTDGYRVVVGHLAALAQDDLAYKSHRVHIDGTRTALVSRTIALDLDHQRSAVALAVNVRPDSCGPESECPFGVVGPNFPSRYRATLEGSSGVSLVRARKPLRVCTTGTARPMRSIHSRRRAAGGSRA